MQQKETNKKKRVRKYPLINAELVKRNETYSDLGNGINLSKSAVSRRMTGEVAWDIEEIKNVCKYFNKSFSELF